MSNLIAVEILTLWALRMHKEGTFRKLFGVMGGEYTFDWAGGTPTEQQAISALSGGGDLGVGYQPIGGKQSFINYLKDFWSTI